MATARRTGARRAAPDSINRTLFPDRPASSARPASGIGGQPRTAAFPVRPTSPDRPHSRFVPNWPHPRFCLYPRIGCVSRFSSGASGSGKPDSGAAAPSGDTKRPHAACACGFHVLPGCRGMAPEPAVDRNKRHNCRGFVAIPGFTGSRSPAPIPHLRALRLTLTPLRASVHRHFASRFGSPSRLFALRLTLTPLRAPAHAHSASCFGSPSLRFALRLTLAPLRVPASPHAHPRAPRLPALRPRAAPPESARRASRRCRAGGNPRPTPRESS